MFTGIITNKAIVSDIIKKDTECEIVLKTDLNISEIVIGQSIACDGACLTVSKIEGDNLSFFVSKESLDKTNIANWKIGYQVNLELAMAANGRFDGHVVSGHVDSLAIVKDIILSNESHILKISLPKKFMSYIIEKGSVTLNGISLTVNDVENDYFTVNIIPHTWKETNFNQLQIGAKLNYEVDLIAKYIKKFNE